MKATIQLTEGELKPQYVVGCLKNMAFQLMPPTTSSLTHMSKNGLVTLNVHPSLRQLVMVQRLVCRVFS